MIFDARILAMRIKKQRNKRNMTQEHLAEIANLSVVFISNVERAKRVPSLEKMIDICNALECTMDELLDGFIAAKTSSAHSQLDSLIAESSAPERIFLAKLCSIMKDYLSDIL